MRCCININKNVLLNKQVLHVNLSIFIFPQSNLKQSTEIHLRRTITKGLVTNDAIDSWAVTVYEWEIGVGDWKKKTQKKTRKKERSLKWKSATNSLKMLPFHKAILRVIVCRCCCGKADSCVVIASTHNAIVLYCMNKLDEALIFKPHRIDCC